MSGAKCTLCVRCGERLGVEPYIPIIPSILAVVSAFIALVVAQFFRDNMIAKAILVVAAALCGTGAVAATIYNQHAIVVKQEATEKRNREIRAGLGSLIQEGTALFVDCGNASNKPVPQVDGWLHKVMDFLNSRLDHSYTQRLTVPIIDLNKSCRGASAEYDAALRIVLGTVAHLNEFSQQSSF
jgi:hypothetical protein